MNKLVWIIGMRRSGTSLLRELINSHPEVNTILFEPHELLFTVQSIHIKRYSNNPYHLQTMEKFNQDNGKWHGAKVALNAGIEAMNWKWLDEKFNKPKYIFIQRDPSHTYQSWIDNETSKRCICSYEMYLPWYKHINNSFEEFVKNNLDRSCIINYERLVIDVNREINKAWSILGLNPINSLANKIRKPNNWSE